MSTQEVSVSMSLADAQAFAKYREEQQNNVMVKPRAKSDRHMAINMAFGQQYQILRVNSNSSYYYKTPKEAVYERLTDHRLNTIVRDIYLSGGWTVDAKEVKEASDTIRMMTTEEVDDLNNDTWYVTPRIFWDTDLGELTDKPRGYCFRKLFNTNYADKHTVKKYCATFSKN